MSPHAVLYPSFAMFAMSALFLGALGIARVQAVRSRAVKLRYYSLFNDGEETPGLRKLSRHVQNHFEVPPLLHLGCLLAFVTAQVTPWTVGLAWAFVGLRAVHSVIHLGPNDVNLRFTVFALALFAVVGLWAAVLVGLLA